MRDTGGHDESIAITKGNGFSQHRMQHGPSGNIANVEIVMRVRRAVHAAAFDTVDMILSVCGRLEIIQRNGIRHGIASFQRNHIIFLFVMTEASRKKCKHFGIIGNGNFCSEGVC